MKRRLVIVALLVALVVAIVYWLSMAGTESTDDAQIDAYVIPIIPKVAGYVTQLHVTDNQHVKAGDVLVQIDPRDFDIAQAQSQALVAMSEANLTNKTLKLRRQQGMTTLARSKEQLEDAQYAQLQAEAQLAAAKSQLAKSSKDLSDAQVIATVNGIITNRGVEQGAYVKAGEQLMNLVPDSRWVIANFKETQLEHMRPGQKATIKVDAYPDLELKGHVDSIQRGTGARFSLFPPENATGNYVKIVQRVPVKILIDSEIPAEVTLGPGMSVVPTVDTDSEPGDVTPPPAPPTVNAPAAEEPLPEVTVPSAAAEPGSDTQPPSQAE